MSTLDKYINCCNVCNREMAIARSNTNVCLHLLKWIVELDYFLHGIIYEGLRLITSTASCYSITRDSNYIVKFTLFLWWLPRSSCRWREDGSRDQELGRLEGRRYYPWLCKILFWCRGFCQVGSHDTFFQAPNIYCIIVSSVKLSETRTLFLLI